MCMCVTSFEWTSTVRKAIAQFDSNFSSWWVIVIGDVREILECDNEEGRLNV